MTSTPKAPKVEDLANKDLAKQLGATVNETALRAWFDKSAEMILAGSLSARGWNATVEASNSSSVLRSTWGAYVVRAYNVGKIKGGDSITVKALITTTQDAARAWKADDFKAQVEGAKSFKAFKDSIPARESKSRGAGATADEKAAKAVKDVVVDADSVIHLALGFLTEMDDLTIRKVEDAERLVGILKSAIRESKLAQTPNHPAVVNA